MVCYLILGANKLGQGVIHDLYESDKNAKIVLVDYEKLLLTDFVERYDRDRVSAISANIFDLDELSYLFSSASVVINCHNKLNNYLLSKIAIESGTNFCDIGVSETIINEQYLLDEMAKRRGVVLAPNFGLLPAVLSIMSAQIIAQFDEIDNLALRAGCLPTEPRGPLNYSIDLFSETFISGVFEDASILCDNQIFRVPSYSGIEKLEYSEYLKQSHNLEIYHLSHGFNHFINSVKDKVKNLDFKRISYSGFAEKIVFLKDLGFLDMLNPTSTSTNSSKHLFIQLVENKLPKEEPDLLIAQVIASGKKNNKTKEIIIELFDRMDEINMMQAIVRMNAIPLSIVAQMIANDEINVKGCIYPEKNIAVSKFLEELTKRNIKIKSKEKLF